MPDDSTLEQLKKLLWEEWDPIGVNHLPGSRDEYDSYGSELWRKLQRGTTADRVASYLDTAEAKDMGLAQSRSRNRAVAERILGLFR